MEKSIRHGKIQDIIPDNKAKTIENRDKNRFIVVHTTCKPHTGHEQ